MTAGSDVRIGLISSRSSREEVEALEARPLDTLWVGGHIASPNRSPEAMQWLARLVALIRKAAHRPKVRRKTQPSRAAKQRRLQTKKARGEVKRSRRRVKGNDSE